MDITGAGNSGKPGNRRGGRDGKHAGVARGAGAGEVTPAWLRLTAAGEVLSALEHVLRAGAALEEVLDPLLISVGEG